MKKLTALLITAALLLSVGTVGFAEQNDAAYAEDAISAYMDAIDMDYAYNLTYKLSTDPELHDNELGFRTAGSDAEHRAADFLAAEMEAIGLTDVQKVPVSVDRWQFNGASLTIEGSDFSTMPVSYMVNGTSAEGITAEIVDVGTGFWWDYEDVDVNGKIVLCGVDQYNESWIGQYMYEAALHGAAAIVTYDIGGYGRYSDDIHQIQDVCAEDVLPTVCITANEYKAIAEELEKGNNMATLVVDSVMEIGEGTSYNVIGYIKGRSDAQQIVVSGHYDMYFTGFQDDCAAIATAFSIVKAMIDSGYTPENDIVLVCHGAEEWGISGAEFDWTRGAWEMVNTAHPEWGSKTLAMFNFELSAFTEGDEECFGISCVPEYASLVETLVSDTGLLDKGCDPIFPEGINAISYDTTTMEDGISYREAGVPYFINATSVCTGSEKPFEETWAGMHYHTESDDETTYSREMMFSNIAVFGAIAEYIDMTPALELDLTATIDDICESYYGFEELAVQGGADTAEFEAAVAAAYAAAEEHSAKITAVNEAYAAAAAAGAAQEELDAIRAEGRELNQLTIKAFKLIQDKLIGIIFSSDVVARHVGYLENVLALSGIVEALENGELYNDDETGALDLAWTLNGIVEYGYYIFSPESVQAIRSHVDPLTDGPKLWGENMGYLFAETMEATLGLLEKSETGEENFSAELGIYSEALAGQLALLGSSINGETDGLYRLALLLGE